MQNQPPQTISRTVSQRSTVSDDRNGIILRSLHLHHDGDGRLPSPTTTTPSPAGAQGGYATKTETHLSVAASMGITPEILDKSVPLTCKTGGDREYATLRELLSAADKFGVHFWSFDRTKIKGLDDKFRQVAKGNHPDKGAVDCIACFPLPALSLAFNPAFHSRCRAHRPLHSTQRRD